MEMIMNRAENMLYKAALPFMKSLGNFAKASFSAAKGGEAPLAKMKFKAPPKKLNAVGGGTWNKANPIQKSTNNLAPNRAQQQMVANSSGRGDGLKHAWKNLKADNTAAANTALYGGIGLGAIATDRALSRND